MILALAFSIRPFRSARSPSICLQESAMSDGAKSAADTRCRLVVPVVSGGRDGAGAAQPPSSRTTKVAAPPILVVKGDCPTISVELSPGEHAHSDCPVANQNDRVRAKFGSAFPQGVVYLRLGRI